MQSFTCIKQVESFTVYLEGLITLILEIQQTYLHDLAWTPRQQMFNNVSEKLKVVVFLARNMLKLMILFKFD